MHKPPSPLMEMLMKELVEVKKHLKEIHEKMDDPSLFEKLEVPHEKKEEK